MWTSTKTVLVIALCIVGCATAPDTTAGRNNLEASARDTVNAMIRRDPGLQTVLNRSAGYVVFPKVGKGGALIGGAFGQGVLFERGQRTGFVKLEQASIGAQLGGETFAELLVLQDAAVVRDVKDGDLTLGADAGVTVLTAGAAATTEFNRGIAAFVMPLGGMMVDVSVSGQRIQYIPAG